MKKCTYCGKEYPDEASICANDAQPLRDVAAPSPPTAPSIPVSETREIIDSEHIRLLAIFHFILAGLSLVGIAFLCFHYLIMSTVFANPDLWRSQRNGPPFPKDFFKVFIWFYIFFGFIIGTACVLNLLSALFLRQRKHRIFSMVVGGLNCIQIPLCTGLGIFTIIVLSRKSVREKYGASCRQSLLSPDVQ